MNTTIPKITLLAESPQRMYINQPSTLQDFNEYHGRNVITVPPILPTSNVPHIRVYFTKGSLVSMIIPVGALARGWTEA